MGLWNKPEANLPTSSHHQQQKIRSSSQNYNREESDDVFHETLNLRTTTTTTTTTNNENEKQSLFNRRDPDALPWSLRGASPSDDTNNDKGEQAKESITDDTTYQRIMAFKNIALPHQCFVAVIDGSLFSENTANSSYPVVWCDIITPRGLNITAEIKDGSCDTYNEPASSEYYTEGKASPIYLPTFTTKEKLQGTFDHSYCAGIDVLYDVNQNGVMKSIVNQRFAMEVTYAYDNVYDEQSGEVVDEIINTATLSNENTKSANRNESLAIGLGVLAGSILTLALIALIYGEKKRRKWRKGEDIDINNENELREIDAAEEEGLDGGQDEDVKVELASIT